MFKKGSTSWLVWNIIEAVLLLVGGIFTIIFAGNGDFQSVIVIIVGIALITVAALHIILQFLLTLKTCNAHFVKEITGGGVPAALEMASGIALITIANNMANAEIIFSFVGTFLGILLAVGGSFMLLFGIIFMASKKVSVSEGILSIILGAAAIALGVVVIVYLTNRNMLTATFVIVGILLILAAIAIFAGSILVKKKLKEVENIKDAIVEDK